MAGVAEKARFYLERSVPQLREFEEKEIFSKDEIRTLVSKRTDFEHLVLSPGNKPSDFQSYITWEQSLEQLRAKRCRRLKIRHSSNHAGQARIFQIYERAVSRHPGDNALWRQYLDYAAKVGATKRWRKIVTRALRMHPTDPGLWVTAGRRAARDGDMENARAMFMRGCRFCTKDERLWVEYARLEMEWLVRMEKKKGTKAFALAAAAQEVDEDGNVMFDEDEDEDGAEDSIILPDLSAEQPNKPKIFTQEAVRKLEKSPAMDGAIPKAIFDISRKQGFYKAATGESFFNMFASFTDLIAQSSIIQHVLASMAETHPNDPSTFNCQIRKPLIGMSPDTAAFPKALRESLAVLKSAMDTTTDKSALATKTIGWIDPILSNDNLDSGIKTVLEHAKRKLESR